MKGNNLLPLGYGMNFWVSFFDGKRLSSVLKIMVVFSFHLLMVAFYHNIQVILHSAGGYFIFIPFYLIIVKCKITYFNKELTKKKIRKISWKSKHFIYEIWTL